MNLTNQELISELEKRIKNGTIKMEVDNKIHSDSLTSRLFNFRKSSEEQTSDTSLFNRNTLLWITLIGVALLIFYPKRLTVSNEVRFLEDEE